MYEYCIGNIFIVLSPDNKTLVSHNLLSKYIDKLQRFTFNFFNFVLHGLKNLKIENCCFTVERIVQVVPKNMGSTAVCSQNINKQNVNIADKTLTDYNFLSRHHYIKQRIIYKDDIEFVTEFPCLLGHPVH